jgi:L-amino acid N-acyltransferase YncA
MLRTCADVSDRIRFVEPHDAAAIAAIYAPIVAGTWISFEEVPPGESEMRERIEHAAGSWPFLCIERTGGIAGYAYASPHRERASYRWSVDVSVYVHEGCRRTGVARRLYETLFAILREQGYYNAFAGITLPNDASVGLHHRLGFNDVGIYRNVGYKLGAWRDTIWMQRGLKDARGVPSEPIPLRALAGTDLGNWFKLRVPPP